jgi:hypothetical protein
MWIAITFGHHDLERDQKLWQREVWRGLINVFECGQHRTLDSFRIKFRTGTPSRSSFGPHNNYSSLS